MTVTVTSLSTNTKKIDVSGETRVGPIITEFDNVITSLGWTLHDTVSSGSRNCMVTKVYSAPNDDDATNPTTKYVILRFDAPKGYIYFSCAEDWNASTHVATNESYDFERTFGITLQTSNISYAIIATPRYMVIQSIFFNEPGVWQGVFEWQRNSSIPTDTAADGAPCFGYTNGIIFGEVYVANSTDLNHTQYIVPPRTLDGYTGWGASKTYALNTVFGSIPPNSTILSEASGSSSTTNGLGIGNIGKLMTKSYFSPLDDTKTMILSPTFTSKYNKYIETGRIYGLTIAATSINSGPLDTVDITVDSDGFYSENGTSTNHFIFNLSGCVPSQFSQEKSTMSVKGILPVYSASIEYMVKSVIVRGRYLYAIVTNATYLYKYDMITNTASIVTIDISTGFGSDIIFDGEDSIYVSRTYRAASSTSNYCTKLNINDDTYETYPVSTTGAGALAIDDTYLYWAVHTAAASTTSTVIPSIRIYNLSDTVSTATPVGTFTPPASSPWNVNTCSIAGLETADYSGYLYAFYINAGTTLSTLNSVKAIKIDPSTATSLAINATNVATYSGYPDTPTIVYTIDGFSVRPYWSAGYTSSGHGYAVKYSVADLTHVVEYSSNTTCASDHGNYNTTSYPAPTSSYAACTYWNNTPRPPVYWRGFNFRRHGILGQVYFNSYGNVSIEKGVFDGTRTGRSQSSGTALNRMYNTSSQFNTYNTGGTHKHFATDGTFLYTMGRLNSPTNYVYGGQSSGEHGYGFRMPSILIKG